MRALVPTAVIVVAIGYLYTVFARVWTDHLWYASVDYHQVFTTMLGTQVVLFLVSGLLMGVPVSVTVWLALRTHPLSGTRTPLQDSFHALSGWRRRGAVLIPGAAIGILTGVSWLNNTQLFLAWVNRVPFRSTDARFNLDISFYIFEYPWYRAVNGLFIAITVICAIAAVVTHFLNGSFLAMVGGKRATARAAHVQIGILLGLITIGYGFSKILDRYGLLLDTGGLLDGLRYTTDHAQLTANLVLAIIAFLTAILFFVAAARRSWRLPVISVSLIVVSSLIIGMAYPAIIQSLTVTPTEPDKEAPYMRMHIDATRAAYAIDNVVVQDYSAVTRAEAGQLKSDAEALPGIRLIDPAMVQDTFEQLQQVRGYYTFSPVLDVDRYIIDGKQTDVVLAAREMDHNGLNAADRNWNNLHTVYTHGYGLVAAYGNRLPGDGEPDWLAKDIPTVGPLSAAQPRIYYGEKSTDYAIVGRLPGDEPIEFDTPGGGVATGTQYNTYTGSGGVPIGSFGDRLLYATRFANINLVLSSRINSESKILYDRTPQERVHLVAPWLTTDSDIYPALVDGRIVWIVDAYTTSVNYPNAQRVTYEDAISDTLTDPTLASFVPKSEINYMRNAVKAVVDAYDGTVTLYQWDETDPILQTWMKVFPGAVQPKSAISDDLKAHLRYPEDLFKIQRQMLARYHMTEPGQWYNQSDLWRIPPYPVQERSGSKEPTYFLSIKWPDAQVGGETVKGDPGPLFSQTTVYTPNARVNLAAYMAVVAEATSDKYGQIRILKMSDTQQIDGPGQAYNQMMADENVSKALLPYSSESSVAKAQKGNLLTLPLGGGLLYVEPIYTKQVSAQGSYPILRFVVVRFGTHVAIDTTLQGALDKVFAGNAGANTGETTQPGNQTGPGEQPQTRDEAVNAALAEAQAQFQKAADALARGDLAGYQAANEAAKAAVEKAIQAMGG